MRYVCTGSFASMVTVHVNRPIPAHFLASERSYSCAFPLQLNGVPSARFPAHEHDDARVIAHVVVPVITPVIARDYVCVIAPVIAREQACVQDRNAQSAIDTPQAAPCAAYGTTQA